jgi:hypothetical protein
MGKFIPWLLLGFGVVGTIIAIYDHNWDHFFQHFLVSILCWEILVLQGQIKRIGET